jgi:glycosyltransferase involved in cell wall biosynthesis
MSKTRVLEIINTLGVGGAQRTLESFCRYLSKDLFEVKIAAVEFGGKRAEELMTEGFLVDVFNGDVAAVKNYLQREKFDILHLHRSGRFEQHWLSILKERLVPFVVETNVFAEFDKTTNPFIDVHLCKSMMMLNERYLPNLSKSERGSFWPKYRVLYNPVDVGLFDRFKLSDQEIADKRRELRINEGEFVIGKVGARAAIEKWSWLVVDMLPLLLREIPNVKMIIQSAPAEVVENLKQKPYADRFIFCPETTDEREQAGYYQLLDVFVHTSKIGEAFGNTLNEAMVWRKPIVTSSTPWADNGQLEQVEHGKNGFLASTPRSFAAAVAYLLKNESQRQNLGRAGRSKIETKYSPVKTVANLENIFLQVGSFDFYPSRKLIEEYRQEYKQRLLLDFIKPTFLEKLKYVYLPQFKGSIAKLKNVLLQK